MFMGAYRFAGDPAELVPAYDRLMANMPADAISLHLCLVEDGGIVVLDACPTRDVFMEFSSSSGFAAAVAGAGLPVPSVEPMGEVHVARMGEGIGG
jgi:hypothetical protein